MGGMVALYFDGAVCMFKELPNPKDKVALERVYQLINNNKNDENKLFLLISQDLNNSDKKLQKKNIFSTFATHFKKITIKNLSKLWRR